MPESWDWTTPVSPPGWTVSPSPVPLAAWDLPPACLTGAVSTRGRSKGGGCLWDSYEKPKEKFDLIPCPWPLGIQTSISPLEAQDGKHPLPFSPRVPPSLASFFFHTQESGPAPHLPPRQPPSSSNPEVQASSLFLLETEETGISVPTSSETQSPASSSQTPGTQPLPHLSTGDLGYLLPTPLRTRGP